MASPLSPALEQLGAAADFTTGILVLDAVLCLLASLLFQHVTAALQQSSETSLFSRLRALFSKRQQSTAVRRTIEITQRFNKYGNKIWDYEQKNHLLQKAISIFLADTLDLKGKNAKYELLQKPKKPKQLPQLENDKDNDDAASTSSTLDSVSDSGTEDDIDYGEVNRLNVEALPPLNEWVKVAPGISFMHEVAAPAEGDEKAVMTEGQVKFHFESSLPDASKRIDTLINQAFTLYQETERKKHVQDKTRYFYIQDGMKTTAEDKPAVVAYKRYALGEEKTFENLFFNDKQQVMTLLDNFTNRTGKFAIKGFPYKLGLLLHGPPGTGKTSLIKAVAQHTKRHIVTISLGKIKTNQELLDALFDMKFAVEGMDTPIEMTFKDVVFVMEDIDCASSVVNSREAEKEDDSKLDSKTKRMMDSQKKATEKDDDLLMSAVIGPALEPKTKDKLSLSGLLNVLDGVIDCPGRILIMTTNHPEKLDPALIRPGRVNKKLLLSYMGCEELQQMIEYYCSTELTPKQTELLQTTFANATERMTPAEIEELCAEYDGVDSILEQLHNQTTAIAA